MQWHQMERIPQIRERPYEEQVRVKPDESGVKLDEMSRIDYGGVHKLEKDIGARASGWVEHRHKKDIVPDLLNESRGKTGYKAREPHSENFNNSNEEYRQNDGDDGEKTARVKDGSHQDRDNAAKDRNDNGLDTMQGASQPVDEGNQGPKWQYTRPSKVWQCPLSPPSMQKHYQAGRIVEVSLMPPEDPNARVPSEIDPIVKTRRYVIIQTSSNNSNALAIKTYNGSGIATTPNMVKSHHNVIHNGRQDIEEKALHEKRTENEENHICGSGSFFGKDLKRHARSIHQRAAFSCSPCTLLGPIRVKPEKGGQLCPKAKLILTSVFSAVLVRNYGISHTASKRDPDSGRDLRSFIFSTHEESPQISIGPTIGFAGQWSIPQPDYLKHPTPILLLCAALTGAWAMTQYHQRDREHRYQNLILLAVFIGALLLGYGLDGTILELMLCTVPGAMLSGLVLSDILHTLVRAWD